MSISRAKGLKIRRRKCTI